MKYANDFLVSSVCKKRKEMAFQILYVFIPPLSSTNMWSTSSPRQLENLLSRDWGTVDEVLNLGLVLLHCCLSPFQVLQEGKDLRVCHIEAGLTHIVLDLHVGVVFGQDLTSFSLSPVGCCMKWGPTIKILCIDWTTSFHQDATIYWKLQVNF